jgi:hypothetical protein
MNRRERLMATLNGKTVDRPPVSFSAVNGTQDEHNPDPFNIYNDPSWAPLLKLAREKTDRMVNLGQPMKNAPPDPVAALSTWEQGFDANGSRITTRTIKAGGKVLTERGRVDRDTDTYWITEHLIKNVEDFRAWLELPAPAVGGEPDLARILEVEKALGDTGIVLLDMPDPLYVIASLFEMGEFTIVALCEPELMHRALEKVAESIQFKVDSFAQALPGRLWRIFGSEYASAPFLPPRLHDEYFVHYAKPIIQSIQKHGGFARVHSHGRLRGILDNILATGCAGIDPIEPPPQGDVELSYVREKYGKDLVLFGNIEVSDIENLPTDAFAEKVKRSLEEGTSGSGRGFVLMTSAPIVGRVVQPLTLRNYETMIKLAEKF